VQEICCVDASDRDAIRLCSSVSIASEANHRAVGIRRLVARREPRAGEQSRFSGCLTWGSVPESAHGGPSLGGGSPWARGAMQGQGDWRMGLMWIVLTAAALGYMLWTAEW